MKTVERRKKTKDQKTACVCRYGAWGDAVLMSPVLRALKQDGYHITLNCTEPCYEILQHDPNIDCFMVQKTNEIPQTELGPYWTKMEKLFDRWIQLNGSIEGRLLKIPNQINLITGQDDYTLPKMVRHEMCNRNYMDETMMIAGYPDRKGEQPDLYFTEEETKWAKMIREKHKGFLVVWGITGSSVHKIYPYADAVIQALVEGRPEAQVLLVGEKGGQLIIDPHDRIFDWCGDISIRQSFILTKIADLVVSPETSVANASSCFDTPKVVILSHSTEENLTKYWRNCTSVFEPVQCYPCHKLHYEKNSCPIEPTIKMPLCQALLHPSKLFPGIEAAYRAWAAKQIIRV